MGWIARERLYTVAACEHRESRPPVQASAFARNRHVTALSVPHPESHPSSRLAVGPLARGDARIERGGIVNAWVIRGSPPAAC